MNYARYIAVSVITIYVGGIRTILVTAEIFRFWTVCILKITYRNIENGFIFGVLVGSACPLSKYRLCFCYCDAAVKCYLLGVAIFIICIFGRPGTSICSLMHFWKHSIEILISAYRSIRCWRQHQSSVRVIKIIGVYASEAVFNWSKTAFAVIRITIYSYWSMFYLRNAVHIIIDIMFRKTVAIWSLSKQSSRIVVRIRCNWIAIYVDTDDVAKSIVAETVVKTIMSNSCKVIAGIAVFNLSSVSAYDRWHSDNTIHRIINIWCDVTISINDVVQVTGCLIVSILGNITLAVGWRDQKSTIGRVGRGSLYIAWCVWRINDFWGKLITKRIISICVWKPVRGSHGQHITMVVIGIGGRLALFIGNRDKIPIIIIFVMGGVAFGIFGFSGEVSTSVSG